MTRPSSNKPWRVSTYTSTGRQSRQHFTSQQAAYTHAVSERATGGVTRVYVHRWDWRAQEWALFEKFDSAMC